MKSVKNILAMVTMVTILGVSSSFGTGIYLGDRSVNNQCDNVKTDTIGTVLDLGGIIVAGFTGIIVAGKSGIIVAGKEDVQQPCTTEGGTAIEGIIVAG